MKIINLKCVLTLLLFWVVNCACGVEYGTDFLESGNPGSWSESLKTFDEEWTTSSGNTFDVDIWIKNLPENLITAGFLLEYDESQLSVISCDVYDGSLPGPWDPDMTNKVLYPSGPGTYMVIVGNLSSVVPDRCGDIPIARIEVVCNLLGDTSMKLTPIDHFDTVVGNSSKVYDSDITPHTVSISPD